MSPSRSCWWDTATSLPPDKLSSECTPGRSLRRRRRRSKQAKSVAAELSDSSWYSWLTRANMIEDFWLRRRKNLQDERVARCSIHSVDPAIRPVFFWTWKVNIRVLVKNRVKTRQLCFSLKKDNMNISYPRSLYSWLSQCDRRMLPNQWHHTQRCWINFPAPTCEIHS